MTELEHLEREVESLSPGDLAKFRRWFLEFDWKQWDERIEEDLRSGRLDRMLSEAMNDFKAGRAREL